MRQITICRTHQSLGGSPWPTTSLQSLRPTLAAALELTRLSGALQKAVALPGVRERRTNWGLSVGHMTGPQMNQREQAYTQSWAGIIRRSGFVAQ